MRAKTGPAGLRKFIALLMMSAASATMIAQQQPPAVSRPSTSNVQVTPRQEPSPYGNAPNPAAGLQRAQGTITGYVYWQMNILQPSSTCQGLSVKVITVNKVGMPLQLLSTTNTLTAAGPVIDNSASGTPKYMLCSYSFQSMPENVALRVLLYGAPSSASVSLPPSFQIPGGNCNSTPSGTLSFILTGGEMICGNGAFNINFKLTSVPLRPTAPSILQPSAAPGGMLPGTPQAGMLSNPASPTNATNPAGTLNSSSGATMMSSPSNATAPTASSQTGLLTSAQSSVNTNSGSLTGASGVPGNPTRSQNSSGFSGGVRSGPSGNSTQQTQLNPAPTPSLGNTNGSPSVPNAYVPKMPPISSNPKRDASPQAGATERAKIQATVKAQLAAARQQMGGTASSLTRPPQSNVSEIQALQQQIAFANTLRTQGAPTNATLLATKLPNQVRMQPPLSSNPLAQVPPPSKFCPAPQIHAVNGKTSGVVFTQDPAYNDYIIVGCGFGTQVGQVYLSGAISNGRIDMVVKRGQWSDTRIEASVQPGLTGVLDGWPDLIVAPPPAGSPTAKLSNTRFYAQRQSVLLPNIPQQYVTLANVPVGDGSQGPGTMYCPGPDLTNLFPCVAFNAGYKIDGFTNGIDHRHDTQSWPVSNAVDRNGNRQQFDSGEDIYDLSYMAPGFQIDYPRVFWYAWTMDVCEGWSSDPSSQKLGDSVRYETLGDYSWQTKTPTKIAVDWGVDHCAWRWLGVFRVDDWYNSGYSLQVYVKGPIGVDPWTGHAVSTPRNLGAIPPNTAMHVPAH